MASEKSLERPKSISFTFDMSSLFLSRKFSGFISLGVRTEWEIPVGNLVFVKVLES